MSTSTYRVVMALVLSVAVALGAVARSGATSRVRTVSSRSRNRSGSTDSSSRSDRTGRSSPRSRGSRGTRAILSGRRTGRESPWRAAAGRISYRLVAVIYPTNDVPSGSTRAHSRRAPRRGTACVPCVARPPRRAARDRAVLRREPLAGDARRRLSRPVAVSRRVLGRRRRWLLLARLAPFGARPAGRRPRAQRHTKHHSTVNERTHLRRGLHVCSRSINRTVLAGSVNRRDRRLRYADRGRVLDAR